ncbi:glycosyltransferase [Halorubrum sp. GN11GM_10-3_MGM]|uniref:glycosyltransferase n=1 Tax=Halorubrum sp. GN11GM_10-3_MGM TaxID=2518111 RepID=UPI0010F695A5|nr:glycosyltransferase [Halorubrum sp. GN11GM_10-3_MGM]TKX69201.1 glycosyltransferase [Halorubrum sp. GN11GM_10-3_MGM]
MNIVHISTRDGNGGAFEATSRLHTALREVDVNVNSTIITQNKTSNLDDVRGPSGDLGTLYDYIRRKIDQVPLLLYPNRNSRLFSSSIVPSRSQRKYEFSNYDIINLHWITGGFIKIEEMSELNSKIVWTLHDMWPFTGGCHYTNGCKKYTDICQSCPHLNSKKKDDLANRNHIRKLKSWEDTNFTVIAPSKWLAEQAKKSSIFSDSNIYVIPNTLNINKYRPRENTEIRSSLNISPEKSIILFGASRDSYLKGSDLFYDSLCHLNDYSDIVVITFGKTTVKQNIPDDLDIKRLGFIPSKKLRHLYSAADVMVVPSRQEAFGQTASEAMSSGTPVVAFKTTGLRDVVDHKQNGYLATPFEQRDLAKGIEWCMRKQKISQNLGINARNKAVGEYSYQVVANKYIDLYKKI